MPLNILRIQKNASTSLGFLGSILTSDSDLSIVAVREPIERFWSACKTLHPKLTWFRKPFMSDGQWQTPAFNSSYPIADAIEECVLEYLVENTDRHFKRQMDFIGDSKFDYVFRVEDVDVELHKLLQSGVLKIKELTPDAEYGLRIAFIEYVKNHGPAAVANVSKEEMHDFSIEWKKHILNGYHLTVSPKERDQEALLAIRSSKHYDKLCEYYSKDLEMWNDLSILLKER